MPIWCSYLLYLLRDKRSSGADGATAHVERPPLSSARERYQGKIGEFHKCCINLITMRNVDTATIVSSSSGWGRVAIGGECGFDCPISAGNILLQEICSGQIISAHAESKVLINLQKPMNLSGFLSGTANLDLFNPVCYTINHNFLGALYGPGETTSGINLAPGSYLLQCECKPPPHCRHSGWLLRETAPFDDARLAIMSVGRYPETELNRKISDFTRSAVGFGMLAKICGAGLPFRSFYLDKIVDLLAEIRVLPSQITHVLFSDSVDSFLLAGERDLLDRFSELGAEFVISMERECWPARDADWSSRFSPALDDRCWPNSGGWMATKDGAVSVLTECIRIHEGCTADVPDRSFESLLPYREHFSNDQWLLQAAFLRQEVATTPDYRAEIFTNFGTADRKLVDNEDYDVRDGRLYCKKSHTYPLVAHFSGSARQECRDQWQAFLSRGSRSNTNRDRFT